MASDNKLHTDNIPSHIAIIMDGNGRWAKKQGEMRSFGHQNAVTSVRETTETCAKLGVKYLTLYAFSTENWGRPKEEVNALMQLLVDTINLELDTLQKNDIKLETIGDIAALPEACQKQLVKAKELTSTNNTMTLVLALNYSGRWDLVNGMKRIAEAVADNKLLPFEVNESTISSYLSTSSMPDPELMIRTSGEMRISNFLLWQLAYTEIYITDTLWPEFRKEDLYQALEVFQQRERRFGKTSEQIIP
ncbi:MAG: isoprenyl transferase [Cyclobacteriaceae bacterium]